MSETQPKPINYNQFKKFDFSRGQYVFDSLGFAEQMYTPNSIEANGVALLIDQHRSNTEGKPILSQEGKFSRAILQALHIDTQNIRSAMQQDEQPPIVRVLEHRGGLFDVSPLELASRIQGTLTRKNMGLFWFQIQDPDTGNVSKTIFQSKLFFDSLVPNNAELALILNHDYQSYVHYRENIRSLSEEPERYVSMGLTSSINMITSLQRLTQHGVIPECIQTGAENPLLIQGKFSY